MKYWNYIPQITGFQYSYLIGHNINEINNISEMNITLTVCVCIHSTFDCNNQYFQAFKYIATLLILSGLWFLSKNLYTKFLRIKLNLSSHLNIVCLKKKKWRQCGELLLQERLWGPRKYSLLPSQTFKKLLLVFILRKWQFILIVIFYS